MIRRKSLIVIGAIALIGFCSINRSAAQEKQEDNGKAGAKTARELKKAQWLKQRKADQAKKAALKAHMQHQSKDVRKRMKKDAKKAYQFNSVGN